MLLRKGAVVAQGPLHEVLTAAHLSETFGLELTVEFRGDRWWARAV
jgi:iron complex transport system ATP-binding protein